MTVAAEAIKIPYACNGSLVDFDFTYKIFDEDDIKVVVTDSLGTETTLAITTDYTVAGENNAFESGGTITTVKEVSGVMENYAYPSGSTITIILNLTLSQPTDLIYGGSYKATSIEQMADRLTKMVQQLSEKLDRSIKFKIDSSLDIEVEDPTTGYFLYSPDGSTLAWVEAVEAGTATITAFSKTLLDDSTASAWLTTLGFTTFIKTLIDDAGSTTALKTLLSLLHSTTAKTANYSIAATDRGKLVKVDATTGNLVVTLLAAATAGDGFSIAVKKTNASANYVTLDPAGAELIDGGAEHILYEQNDAALIICDGTGWKIIYCSELQDPVVGTAGLRTLGTGSQQACPGDDDRLNEGVVQVVNYTTGAYATGNTITPYDDTIPQKTEGDEYMTLAITPTDASNILIIEVLMNVASGSRHVIMHLHQDATANALAAAIEMCWNTYHRQISIKHRMIAGTTSETTFKVRAGIISNGAAHMYVNGWSGARKLGGVLNSSITITEVKP